MNFELGKEYIVKVSEEGIIPIEEFESDRFFDKDHDDLDFLTDEEKTAAVNDALGTIIAGLKAHKWNKDEGSKAIYDSAINDAITYIDEYMNRRDNAIQATDFLAEARACAEREFDQ